jgi:putative transposase
MEKPTARFSSVANGLQFLSPCYRKWLWDKILEHLVEVTRKREGRNPNPTYAIIDSQSVKTVYASEQIGFDGGKKQR